MTERPKLPAWQARSFWLTLFTIATPAAAALGIDLPALVGAGDPAGAADSIVQLIPALTGLWAWRERRAPRFDLDLGPLGRLLGAR